MRQASFCFDDMIAKAPTFCNTLTTWKSAIDLGIEAPNCSSQSHVFKDPKVLRFKSVVQKGPFSATQNDPGFEHAKLKQFSDDMF